MERWLLGIVLCLVGVALTGQAQAQPVDRSALDALVLQVEATEAEVDPVGYRSLAAQVLAEARRIYPETHPEVAARSLYGAISHAAAGEMAQALAIVEETLPVLAGDPGYRGSWRDALSLRAYIHNFLGEHAEALALNEQLVADYSADTGPIDDDHPVVLSNLAASYFEHGRLDDALERNAQAIEMGLTLDPVPPAVAVWSANRVVYLYSSGRTEEAIATAQDALARVGNALGSGHPMLANLYANLGAILFRLNRPNDAMPMIRRAYELIEAAGGGPNQNSAAMRVQFAQALVKAGRHADAIAFLDSATPIIDAQLGEQSDRAMSARDTRLVALIGTGRGAEAQLLAQELLAIRDARLPEGHRDRANARDNLSRAAFANGDWPIAESAAAESVALRSKLLPAAHPDLLLSRAHLLRAQDRGGARPVTDLLADARELFEALAVNANLARGSAQAERQRPAYAWLAEIFARHGATEDAFKAQQWAARTGLDDALAIAASERAVAIEPGFAAGVAQRRQLLAARRGLEAQIEANLAAPDDGFDLAVVTDALEANRLDIAALDATFTPLERARLVFTPSSMAELKASSSDGRTLAMFTDLGDGWLATVAAGEQIVQYPVNAGAPVDALVARVRASLDAGTGQFDRTAAAELHALLFPARAKSLLQPARELGVIANGSLAAFPFGLLVPDKDGNGYLMDQLAVSRLVRAPDGGGSDEVAFAGDGRLVAIGGEGGRAGVLMAMRSAGTAGAIQALPGLPGAERELAALAAALGGGAAHLLIGDQATEAALRATTVPPGAVLAFATHGLLSGELDGLDEPALLLTAAGEDDGLLKPSEIGALDLPARLVILSACNTAAGSDGPRLTGLVQGFFLAGARQVMASHWPVRDDVARRLSVGTVAGLRAGTAPAAALNEAISAVRTGSDGEPAIDDPALWAPFELFSH